MPIFQKSVINKHLKNLNIEKVNNAFENFKKFYGNKQRLANIMQLKEENYQEGFLREVFVETLGYTINPDENYNLTTEYKNQKDARKADGAILIKNKAIGVIELKSTKTKELESIKEQAFGYKNNQPDCKFVITSNFQNLRFYVDNATEYEEFNLFAMASTKNCNSLFQLFYLLLSKDSIFSDLPEKMKQETKFHESDISDKLYADYKHFKDKLFENLVKNNSEYDKLTLFKKSQKLLDRFLFVFFAEDSGLIPPNAVSKIIEQWKDLQELDEYKPLYSRFRKLFMHLDKGHIYKKWGEIPAYNGGLFKNDEILDNADIKIDDNILEKDSLKLSAYDFNTEVDVNILGHIFEHSLNEIEEMEQNLTLAKFQTLPKLKTSKRKKDGIFYTPKYITKYIVENTVGKLCDEKKITIQINKLLIDDTYRKNITANRKATLSKKGKQLYEKLNNYKEWLLTLKILDPACGSGAFLNQTLEFLITEHKQIDDIIAELTGDTIGLFDTDKSILEKNLYGVDINEESVEIAKLSLWLRTAQKGRKLSNLNNNIKCGNSLIDDPEVAGEKAFDWNVEFKEIMDNGGFDVVIGNPPYVNIANINSKKERDYLKKMYKTVKNKSDLYSMFTEKSFFLLKEDQVFSFIFSNSWLGTSSFYEFRKFLIENTQIIELIKLPPDVFADATVTTIIINFRKKKIINNQKIVLKKCVNEQFAKMKYTLDYDRINTTTFKTFSFNPEVKIKIKTVNLGEIANFSLGIKTSNDKRFILSEKIDNDCYPVLRGKHISRYYYKKTTEWIWYKPKLMKEKKGAGTRHLEYFLRDKILFQSISGGLIKAVIDTKKNLTNDKINILYKIDDNFSLKYILSILNSKFIENLFYSYFNKVLEVKINQLQEIPIPLISKESQHPFIEKADLMLSLNKEQQKEKDNFLNTLKEEKNIEKITKKIDSFYNFEYDILKKELSKQKVKFAFGDENNQWREYFNTSKQKINELQTQITQTDKEIDKMVYSLYELTDDEIGIVENSVI